MTSGNLTKGGLQNNYEYGINISNKITVAGIRSDILDYASLGAPVYRQRLLDYCEIAEEVRKSFQDQLSRVAREVLATNSGWPSKRQRRSFWSCA